MSFAVFRQVATVAVMTLALAPAAASATQVDWIEGTIIVDGDAGANAITVTATSEAVFIAEAGAHVVDAAWGDACMQDGARVRCPDFPGGGSVLLRGGDGNDTLTADTADHVIHLRGQAGDDVLNSSPNGYNSFMSGGDGNDTLNGRSGFIGGNKMGPGDSPQTYDTGDAGNDTLNGSTQNSDQFQQEPGADTYNGGTAPFAHPMCAVDPGPCSDSDSIGFVTGPVAVTLDGVANDGQAGEADNVQIDVETVYGTAQNDVLSAAGSAKHKHLEASGGDDTLTGGSGGDFLDGGQGADTLSGGGGGDTLHSGYDEPGAATTDRMDGGDGDDTFGTGLGADDIVGGGGIDSVFFGSRAKEGEAPTSFHVTLDGNPDDGPKGAAEGDNVREDVEIVGTDAGADTLVGSAGADQLSSGAGDDVIDGGGGVDVLDGGSGADTLTSRDAGFDVVNCGAGVDPAVQGDEGDQLHGCEASSLAPLPPPAPALGADTTEPVVVLSGPRSVSASAFGRARGVSVTVKTNEPAILLGESVAKGMLARAGDLVLGQRTLPLSNAGLRRLTMRFPRAYVRAIQRRLRRRDYRLTVRVTATDAAGNRTVVNRRIAIKRAPRRR
jgi:Ca2+-binding RTX toxin-like protein